MVFQSDGELGCYLIEQSQVLGPKSVGPGAAEFKNSQSAIRPDERNAAQGLKSFGQKILSNLGLKTLHLVPRDNHRSPLPQSATSGTVMRADGQRRKEPFTQREVFGLADQQSGIGLVQLEAGILVAQDPADARRDLRKNLLQVPARRYDAAHVQQHLQPILLFAEFPVKVLEGFFQFFWRSDLDHDGADSRDC